MDTKLVDEIYIEKSDLEDEIERAWDGFLAESDISGTIIGDIILECYGKIKRKLDNREGWNLIVGYYVKSKKEDTTLHLPASENFDKYYTKIEYSFSTTSSRELFFEFITNGLIIEHLKDDKSYQLLTSFDYNDKKIQIPNDISISVSNDKVINKLLTEDNIRADIQVYNRKILEDTDLGHWSLWQNKEDFKEPISLKLEKKLVARDPKTSINDGVIGIDFGTKSTVVTYQKDSVNIYPMRIGIGELSKEVEAYHFENPTIMEFNNLERFLEAYNSKDQKPDTKWEDITISHTAYNSMMGAKSDQFNTFLDELKQWAGDKNRKLKVVGKHGRIIDLPPFLELKKGDFNPIEIYAYYLGLNINNQIRGIYLNYILSFPVTYEIEIRNKIIESFTNGIKKSLPAQLGKEVIDTLSVEEGASEPAAYALVALQSYEFEPCGDEKVFYGVFDFGGGTTDFDFGIYREATGSKERRYDYVIEHFGAGGDKYLGGENLLELLAFEVFKKNKSKLLKDSIQFEKHPEKEEFIGSENLLSYSQEAKMNTKTLCEFLRPFWEDSEDKQDDYNSGTININLVDIDGKAHVGYELDLDREELEQILYSRIEKGVIEFFNSLRLAFSNSKIKELPDKINIFLAGNSSKSKILKDIFNTYISMETKKIQENSNIDSDIFTIYEPLGGKTEDAQKPTGKTGVAFGLIETRKGGKIKVIDYNINEESKDIGFKYYIGDSKKKKFITIIDREVKYGKWIEFIDASLDTFELYYTSQSSATTNKMEINDESIKKLTITIDKSDEDALVYIRVVSPTDIEYVVAYEDKINNDEYLTDIVKINLD